MPDTNLEIPVQEGLARTNAGLDLHGLFGVLRKHLITFILTAVGIFSFACVYTFTRPVEYAAVTQLFVTNSSDQNQSSFSDRNNANSYIMSQIKSYPALTTTQAVLQPVIQELHLNLTVDQLAEKLNVSNPTNTVFIRIAAVDSNPNQAARISDAVASSLSKVVEQSLYSRGGQSPIRLSVVQPAEVPTGIHSPNYKVNLALGLLAGIMFGFVAVLIKDALSTRVEDEEEITALLPAPIIGRVPQDGLLGPNIPAVIARPSSPAAEVFRRIRMNLSFIAPVEGSGARLIVLTSAGVNEGKTTLVANIAAALAENGARVLLIDADLRHPSVAKKLDIDGSVGLTHVLSGQAAVKDVIQRYWKPNFHVLPAGPKPPNASTLLNSSIMSQLMQNALNQYDYVLIDTAPMVVANDAVLFVRKGGSLVMVTRRDKTLKKELREVNEELRTIDISVSGLIFNWAKENKKSMEYGSYYVEQNTPQKTKGIVNKVKKSKNK